MTEIILFNCKKCCFNLNIKKTNWLVINVEQGPYYKYKICYGVKNWRFTDMCNDLKLPTIINVGTNVVSCLGFDLKHSKPVVSEMWHWTYLTNIW